MANRTILQVTGMHSTKYGALEHYLVEVARGCRASGYRTVLQYESLPASQAYLRDLAEVGAAVRVSSIRTALHRSLPNLAALILTTRPEVIQTHFLTGYHLLAVPLVARSLGTRRVVAMVHSNYQLRERSPARFAYDRYDHVLGVSNAVTGNLLLAGVQPGKLTTHYLGLPDRAASRDLRLRFRAELGIPEQAPVLACIAFDSAFKGLDLLVSAAAQVIRAHPQVHLLQVGVDPASSALPGLAARLGVSGSIHWAGIRDDGWQLLNAADVYVQSSRFAEGLPLSVLEAMALRLPVVGTRVAGIPEAVVDGETGYLVEPGDPAALAEAIERALADPARSSALGEAGHRWFLQLFREETSVKVLLERYLLPSHPVPGLAEREVPSRNELRRSAQARSEPLFGEPSPAAKGRGAARSGGRESGTDAGAGPPA